MVLFYILLSVQVILVETNTLFGQLSQNVTPDCASFYTDLHKLNKLVKFKFMDNC